MFLPDHVQYFEHPTLIVIADHVQAHVWLAFETTIEQTTQFELPHELKHPHTLSSNNRTSFVNTDHGGSTSAPEPKWKDEERRRWTKELLAAVESAAHKHQANEIFLAMRPDLLHLASDALAHNKNYSITRELPHDVMKEDIVKILERFRRTTGREDGRLVAE